MANNQASCHVLGRQLTSLRGTTSGSDLAFGSERKEAESLENWDFEHCTFAHVSFKDSTIRNAHFINCVFVACYFRGSTLANSHFTGCRFVDCNFNRTIVQSSQFKYSSFHRCQISFAELQHSLPREPNLREMLARNLFLESRGLGLRSEAREYRLAALQALEEHLRAAIVSESEWYKTHFDARARLRARFQLRLSRLNFWFWRYGESAWALFGSTAVLGLFLFPLLFYITGDGIARTNGERVRPVGPRLFQRREHRTGGHRFRR